MDALLMCGGEGSRLDSEVEKPLYPIGGEPMVDRVRRALADSTVETTYAAVSPNAPETRAHLERADRPSIETPGEGYVADLGAALDDPRAEPPILTVAADLPLLSAETVDDVRAAYRERAEAADDSDDAPAVPSAPPSMTVCVPRELKRRLGVTVDESAAGADRRVPTGVNVLGARSGGGSRTDGDSTADRGSDDHPTDDLVHVLRDAGAAINVNRIEDARIAERHLEQR